MELTIEELKEQAEDMNMDLSEDDMTSILRDGWFENKARTFLNRKESVRLALVKYNRHRRDDGKRNGAYKNTPIKD